MKKLLTLIAIMLPLLLAANLTVKVDIPNWQLTRTGQDAMLPLLMQPGNPSLPYYPVKVLIPMGEKITKINLTLVNNETSRSNINLDYVRTPQPISQSRPDNTQKNTAIWTTNALYPAGDYKYLGTQQWKGYELAIINVYAWHYNPVTRQLVSAISAELQIETVANPELRQNQNAMLSTESSFKTLLGKTIANPEQIQSYSKTMTTNTNSRTVDPAHPKRLIIITSQSRLAWFTDFIAWKESKGISTGIYAIEDILFQYDGTDNPAKLRNFILDAYTTWSQTDTPLKYVILGGDDEIIPIRGVYGRVGDTVDDWMPCDLYYGCLDGTWNADGDNLWGEYPQDNPDLLPEVYVGRFPAETQTEFQHIIDKTVHYVDTASYTNNIVNLYGENLNWDPVTWGDDYKNDVALHIPDSYVKQTYYQRDGTYSQGSVWNSINEGAAIMNHMGHANQTFLMGQGNNTIETLRNTEFGFLYSQGCYPAAFDQRTSGAGESIGEHLVTASGGLYAFIGNTRYGWYMPGSIDGASEYFDRQFFVGMYEQNLHQLGQAMEYSLSQNLNAAMTDDVMLWCYYETILFGDPTTKVKLADPTLPCLSMDSYRYDDSLGDADGNLNPGELVKLYTKVRDLPGWGTANSVYITLEGLPEGVSTQICHIAVPQLQAGAYVDSTLYISFQLPAEMPFGDYHYTIRLKASNPDTGAILCDRAYDAVMSITLLDSHFPWNCYYAGKSAPVVGDLQLNGEQQILYVDVYGDGHFIGTNGQQVNSFDFSTDENINRSFAAGPFEMANNPMLSYAFTSRTGKIYAVAHKDSININYLNYDTGSTCLYTPLLADLDGIGGNDVIASAYNRKIYALNYDNQLLSGFPVELPGTFSCELAIADLDNNGTKEIIAGTADGQLWAIESNGTIRTGFPVQLNGTVNGSPLVLNNNKIVVGTSSNMYVINPNGSIYANIQIPEAMAGGAIPVDIDRDGELEIVFITTTGKLYVCEQDGFDVSGFPIMFNEFYSCPPLAADVDGDHQYEIILQSFVNSINIVNNDGTIITGFPFPMSYAGSTPATLTDFDGDGNYEMVCGYTSGVLVVKLRRPVGNMDAWTVYRGSLSRQGSFAATGYLSNNDEVAITEVALSSNYPNPFNPNTTISFSLPKAEKQVSLYIYNTKGQKVKTLHNGFADKGTSNLTWNGKDDSGKPVSSGVYFYRLQTGSKSLSRKMLLLK